NEQLEARKKAIEAAKAAKAAEAAKDKQGSAAPAKNLAWTLGLSAAAVGAAVLAAVPGGIFGGILGAVAMAPAGGWLRHLNGLFPAKKVFRTYFLNGALPGFFVGAIAALVGGAFLGASGSVLALAVLASSGVASVVSFKPYLPGGSNRTPSIRERSTEELTAE